MAFRFQRRIRIAPGISLNISKSGVSATLGRRGASLNFGKRGVYGNLGLPGTGMSYRTRLDKTSDRRGGEKASTAAGATRVVPPGQQQGEEDTSRQEFLAQEKLSSLLRKLESRGPYRRGWEGQNKI